ncbi:hypothetical protein [Rugamonas aquatica]|uniref:Uncharacterized protein n=1 Tax=Rugamonas aquatica TaxID=2743357 RepID=A0A6A7N797_9BURK|nr:hypothetical protein [Rugamonas aquatica]MQA40667.1 hypothetical protein [Rugamonas aquatica]
MAKSGKENLVQSAITLALQSYCSAPGRPQLRQFPPFANQQGAGMRKYCGDIVGLLDDAQALLLEVKERDCDSNLLREFDDNQFADNLVFEELGVPIAYVYNETATLEYYCWPRDEQTWPETTLRQVKRSPPTQLPGRSPAVSGHGSLLEWLGRQQGEDAAANFGRIHGAISGPDDLRNGMLILLYGVSQNEIAALKPAELKRVVGWLRNNSSLYPHHIQKLQTIFGESAAVFSSFARAQPVPPVAPPPADDDDSQHSAGPYFNSGPV